MAANRYPAIAVMVTGMVLAGCAGSMQTAHQSRAAQGDLYAADGEQPADIYRSWYLFNELAGYGSVEGELRIADLKRWDQDEYRSAYYWYRKAAAGGDGIAAANLWYLYETRSESPGDNQQAMGYYQEAAGSDAGLRQLRILLERPRHAQDAHGHGKFGERLEHPPGAAPAAVFEHRFDDRHPHVPIGRHADVVEHAFGDIVAVDERGFAAALDVEIEVHRNQRAAGPFRIRRFFAVADEIAGDHRIGFCVNHFDHS